jgi:glycogen operon protein
MLLGGDELGRTQGGNNNAYCQDNEVSWYDWEHRDNAMLRFTRQALEIFRSNPVLRRRSFFSGTLDGGGRKDVMWIRADGAELTDEDWADPENRVLGMLIPGRATDERDERGRRIRGDTVLLLLNGGNRSRKVTLPRIEGGGIWHEILQTANPGPARAIRREAINLRAHSLVLLRFEGSDRAAGGA